jgi:hypothetical protein
MDFKENTQRIFEAHRKTSQVILSCTNSYHLDGAIAYVNNFKRFATTIDCETKVQKDFLRNTIESVESTLRIKKKSLR